MSREREFYLFLSSDDSSDLHPDNVYSDFTVTLPYTIDLAEVSATGDRLVWSVGLCDVVFKSAKRLASRTILILGDCVESSVIKGRMAPVLRILPGNKLLSTSISSIYNIPVSRSSISSVRIFLRDLSDKPLPDLSPDTKALLGCSLVFTPTVV